MCLPELAYFVLKVSRSASLWLLPVSHLVDVTRSLLLPALLLQLPNTIKLTPLTSPLQHFGRKSESRKTRTIVKLVVHMVGEPGKKAGKATLTLNLCKSRLSQWLATRLAV